MTTGNDVQAAFVAHSKLKTTLTSLLASASQIKELEWQGTDFVYPGVRISVDFYPPVNGCQPKADVFFDVFSEMKSSDESSTIAGVIQNIYHRHPFSVNGITFFSVIVKKVSKPDRTMYGWQSRVEINTILT